MNYAIVYSSRTGNTAMLARAIQEVLPREECIYFGAPDPIALQAEMVYVGFWTDKENCDEDTAAFLKDLQRHRVFLFGTAGYGGAPAYFEKMLSRTRENLAPGVQVVGTYMCQGKMPQAVRTRYEAMEDSPRRAMMLENFDRALSHPDAEDLARLQEMVRLSQSV